MISCSVSPPESPVTVIKKVKFAASSASPRALLLPVPTPPLRTQPRSQACPQGPQRPRVPRSGRTADA